MRTRLPVLMASLLVGCGGGGASDDSATPIATLPPACEQDLWLTHGEGGCFGSDDTWEFKADLAGCAADAVLNVWRTSGEPWDEQHPLAILQEGPDGAWQAYYLALTHRAPEDAWTPGASTALDCQLDSGSVTFAVRVFDTAGALRSCAVWGHAPDVVIDGGASALHSDAPVAFASCEVMPW